MLVASPVSVGSGGSGVHGLLPDVLLLHVKSAQGWQGKAASQQTCQDLAAHSARCMPSWGHLQQATVAQAGRLFWGPRICSLTALAGHHRLVLAVRARVHTGEVGTVALRGADDLCNRLVDSGWTVWSLASGTLACMHLLPARPGRGPEHVSTMETWRASVCSPHLSGSQEECPWACRAPPHCPCTCSLHISQKLEQVGG